MDGNLYEYYLYIFFLLNLYLYFTKVGGRAEREKYCFFRLLI